MDNDTELYAILSHTWEEEEVSFQKFEASKVLLPVGFNEDEPWLNHQIPTLSEPAGSMKGLKKVRGACQKAKMEGYDWIWIDTCCIDKSSSAELSEAINSMFRWYEQAAVCYAYLSDVKSDDDPAVSESSFRNSRWFTRGWTLQELIAPQEVVFLDADWEEIGTRSELSRIISEITTIDENVLEDPANRSEFSSAQRMSWAARRKTTRTEDQAYSLLGIFNVHMPLLYGEGGSNAFKRLQIEVLNSSNDCSLLAWEEDEETWAKTTFAEVYEFDRYVPSERYPSQRSGLLAKGVEMFRNAGNILGMKQNWLGEEGSLRRSGIYVKADTQFVEYNGPIYGPLDPEDPHIGGLSKTLSPKASRYLIENSRRWKASRWRPWNVPFKHFTDSGVWEGWDNVCIALVGTLLPTSNIDNHDLASTLSRPHTSYIAILLERKSGQLITRLHWPPLLILDIPDSLDSPPLRNWPLTLVNAAIHIDQEPFIIHYFENEVFLTGPREYKCTSSADDFSKDGCYRMVYSPARSPCRIRSGFCDAMEFSGGPLPSLPTFTLYFTFHVTRRTNLPIATVAFKKGLYVKEGLYSEDGFYDQAPTNLSFNTKTIFEISGEKYVTILRRPYQNGGTYIVGIEDVPPAPLPPPTCVFWPLEQEGDSDLLKQLPPLPPTVDDIEVREGL